MQTIDRRVTRTRKLLGQALIDLALEKGYDEVTIQDITKRADIGYRTFFRHFNTIDDLLLSVVENIFVEVETLLGMPSFNELQEMMQTGNVERGIILFRYIQENEKIFRVLLLERGSNFFMKPVIEYGKQQIKSVFAGILDDNPKLDITANHILTSTFGLARWWLENDMPYPPEKMGELTMHMIAAPAMNLLLSELAFTNQQ